MHRLEREIVEIIIGLLFMFLSFFFTLLAVIKIIEPSFVLMFTLYSLSLVGLVLGLHGLYSFILIRRSSKEQ